MKNKIFVFDGRTSQFSHCQKYTLKLRTTKTAIVLPTPIQRRFSYSGSPEISAARSVRTGRICPPFILLYRLSNIHCPLSHAQLQLPLPCDINFTTSSSSSIHCILCQERSSSRAFSHSFHCGDNVN